MSGIDLAVFGEFHRYTCETIRLASGIEAEHISFDLLSSCDRVADRGSEEHDNGKENS